MPNRLKPLNLVDWTGGVNLRPESYQLAENELPELLNLEVDPRGGLNTRRGWKTTAVSSPVQAAGEGWLNPTVGTVSTPDPGPLPAECTFVFKVRGPAFSASSGTSTVASQWTPGAGNCSWYMQQDYSYHVVNGIGTNIAYTKFGTSSAGADAASICEPQGINPGDSPIDMRVATVVRLNSAGQQVVATMFDASGSLAGSPAWVGLAPAVIPTVPVFDASGTLRIGGLAPGVALYQGLIYFVELRTGVDPKGGTVLWRFDASEYPGTGTTYVDPRGRQWTLTTATAITPPPTPGAWNPRNAYLHSRSNATNIMLVCNNASIATRTDPSTSWVNTVSGGCTAVPHGADFASWLNDAWIVRGSGQTVTYNGTSTVTLTASGGTNWHEDYAATGGTDTAPVANLIAQHQGHMFVAGTSEDGAYYPNRIRWSHPNNPKHWAKDDYIDAYEGGQHITAMIPFSDRLLIFKPDAVWALFGYDADTWTLNNISRTVGCLNQQLVARNESAVFFLSWPQGVFAYSEGGTVDEISVQIRRVFEDKQINPTAMANAWMGWVGRRLWVSMPYALTKLPQVPAPTDAVTAFVFDPVTKSWTTFQGVDGNVPGPYMERVEADDVENQVTFMRKTPYTVRLDGPTEAAVDEYLPGVLTPFDTKLRTKWIDAGAPTWRKSWRRPDFLLKGLERDAIVNVQVFHDFDSYNAQRSFAIAFTPDNEPAYYNEFAWGDETRYGGADQSSSVERGGTMGRAGTVQLALSGTRGVPWGLNGIIFKFILRRFR